MFEELWEFDTEFLYKISRQILLFAKMQKQRLENKLAKPYQKLRNFEREYCGFFAESDEQKVSSGLDYLFSSEEV